MSEDWNKPEGYEGPRPPPGVILGITHLWANGKFMKLYKCPLCSFQNIHIEVINHHIKFAYDKRHSESGVRI